MTTKVRDSKQINFDLMSTGQVGFLGATALTGDNGLFWDNTNKRLGIGTASPSGPLHVTDSAFHYTIFAGSSAVGTNLLGLGVDTGITNGTPAIQGFNGALNSSVDIILQKNGGNIQFGGAAVFITNTTIPSGGGAIFKHTSAGLFIAGVTGSVLDFALTNPSGTAIMSVPTGTLNVTFGGNVGIGTASPVSKLEVNGLVTVDNDIQWGNNTGFGLLGNDGVRFLSYTTAAGVILGSGAAKVGIPVALQFTVNQTGPFGGSILKHASVGLFISGATGSVLDFAITNPSGANAIISVPTGTLDVNFGGNLRLKSAHLTDSVGTPTVGAGSSIVGTDYAMIITMNAGTTTAVVTFGNTFNNIPAIVASELSASVGIGIGSTSVNGFTITLAANVGGNVVNVLVRGF